MNMALVILFFSVVYNISKLHDRVETYLYICGKDPFVRSSKGIGQRMFFIHLNSAIFL